MKTSETKKRRAEESESVPTADNIEPSESSQPTDPATSAAPVRCGMHGGDINSQADQLSRKEQRSLRVWTYEDKGEKMGMEDTHVVRPRFHKDYHLFGVFDGHAGIKAAKLLSSEMEEILRSEIEQGSGPEGSVLRASLSSSFLEAERRALEQPWDDGSAAIVAVVAGDHLFVANAGDCRAIVCGKGEVVEMSTDHSPNLPEEKKRIEANGEQVVLDFKYRVRTLAMSRAIGDKSLKSHYDLVTGQLVPDTCIIPDPEIKELLLTDQHEYLVIASDGMWDSVKNEDVAKDLEGLTEGEDPADRLQKLINPRRDNITILVVDLRRTEGQAVHP